MPDDIETLTHLVETGLNRGWHGRPWLRDALTGLEVELCLAEGDLPAAHEAMSLYTRKEEGPCPSRR
jgi:hypothetical protein